MAIMVGVLIKNNIANIEKAINLNKEKMNPSNGGIRLVKGEVIRYKAASDFLLEKAVPAGATLNLNSAITEQRAISGGDKRYAEPHSIPANAGKGSLIATNKRILFKGISKNYDILIPQIKFVIYYPDALEIITGEGSLTSLLFQVDRPYLFSYIIADANWGVPLTLKASVSKEYLDGVAAPLKKMMGLLEPLKGPAIKEICKKDRKLDHKLEDLTEDYFDSVIELIKFETGFYKGMLLKPASVYAMDFIKYLEDLDELSHEVVKEVRKANADTPKNLSKSDKELYSERIQKELEEKYSKKTAILSANLSLKSKQALEEIEKMKRELNPPKSNPTISNTPQDSSKSDSNKADSNKSLFSKIIKIFVFPRGRLTLLFMIIVIVAWVSSNVLGVSNKNNMCSSPLCTVLAFLVVYYFLRLIYVWIKWEIRELPKALEALRNMPDRDSNLSDEERAARKAREREREIEDLKWEVEQLKRKSKP